jgi:hypothetical protein
LLKQPPGPPSAIVHEGVSLTEPEDILKAFSCGFFPSEPASSLKHSEVVSEVSCALANPTSSFPAITAKELEDAFLSAKSTKSPGPDGFSQLWLTKFFILIKSYILAIFTLT